LVTGKAEVPDSFTKIEYTVSGADANLNTGSYFASSLYLCVERDKSKPPITDVIVIYPEAKEKCPPGECDGRVDVMRIHASVNAAG